MLQFTTLFRNSVGSEVAGTWYDGDKGIWRVSTVPLRGFPSEGDAIEYYRRFCDPETGIPGPRPRNAENLEHLKVAITQGDAWLKKNRELIEDVAAAVSEQRARIKQLRDTMGGTGRAATRT
jgi:hypothetical protein